MEIRWYGTASVELRSGEDRLLFDPFVPLKGAEITFPVSEYDHFDHIVVTHGHMDHISSIPGILRRNPQAKVYATATPCRTLQKKGVKATSLVTVEYGQELQLGAFTLVAYHGQHARLKSVTPALLRQMLSSTQRGNLPRLLWDHLHCPENDETLLWHIRAEGKELCLMGSLNLRQDVDYPTHADVLLLPYNGWVDNLPPAERVLQRLQPRRVILTHFDNTFPPLTQPLDLTPLLERHSVEIIPYRKTVTI